MIHENDKLNIPKKYLQMSVSELRAEKERVYLDVKSSYHATSHLKKQNQSKITFNL